MLFKGWWLRAVYFCHMKLFSILCNLLYVSFTGFGLILVSSSFFLLLWIPIIRHQIQSVAGKLYFENWWGFFPFPHRWRKKIPPCSFPPFLMPLYLWRKRKKTHMLNQTRTFCKLADNYQRKIIFFPFCP